MWLSALIAIVQAVVLLTGVLAPSTSPQPQNEQVVQHAVSKVLHPASGTQPTLIPISTTTSPKSPARPADYSTGQTNRINLDGTTDAPTFSASSTFAVTPVFGIAPLRVQFSGTDHNKNRVQLTGHGANYYFDFGDGSGAPAQSNCNQDACNVSATHTYVTPGTFSVSMSWDEIKINDSGPAVPQTLGASTITIKNSQPLR